MADIRSAQVLAQVEYQVSGAVKAFQIFAQVEYVELSSSIKSVNGVSLADITSIGGVDIGDIKSIGGVDN